MLSLHSLKEETLVSSSLKEPPRVGLEPTTLRLTAGCSTIELSRITGFYYTRFFLIVNRKKQFSFCAVCAILYTVTFYLEGEST